MTDRERIDQYLAAARHLKNPQSRQHVAIVRAALAIIDAEHVRVEGLPDHCACVGSEPLALVWPCMIAQEHEAKLWQAINGGSE